MRTATAWALDSEACVAVPVHFSVIGGPEGWSKRRSVVALNRKPQAQQDPEVQL